MRRIIASILVFCAAFSLFGCGRGNDKSSDDPEYLESICHYPMLSWKHQLSTHMIHGHIHNDTRADFWPLIRNRDRVLNAGVDVNGFEPVTLEEMIENKKAFYAARDTIRRLYDSEGTV